MSKLIVIDTAAGIDHLSLYLADKDLVAFDTETTGVHKGAQIIGISICAEDNVAYYAIVSKWNATTQELDLVPGAYEAAKDLLESLKGKSLIMHNGTFDCAMVESYFQVRLIDSLHTDTMILAHLLDENSRVGLKELSAKRFGEDSTKEQAAMKASVEANGGVLTKANYEMYKCDAYVMAKYGAKDALLTYKLFMELVPELYDQGLDKFFYEDESMPLLRGPTYELNTVGLRVDVQALVSLQKQLEAECAEDKAYVYQEIAAAIKDKYPGTSKKNTFNIGSNVQLSWLLFGKYGLEFGNLTKAGKTACKAMGMSLPYKPSARKDFIATALQLAGSVSELGATVNGKKKAPKKYKEPWAYIACDKKTLQKLAPRYKWIERLLSYQRKNKILNTYVKGIQSRVQYGVIYPSFLQHGTTSGRYAARNPNFQNLPRDDKRIKEAIIARPGKVFVGADYSQLEPRVFAFYSNDTRLMTAFEGADDFYSVIGMEVYGKTDCTPRKDGSPDAFGIKYKHLRDLSKVIALASTYGSTANLLCQTTGKSVEDTQKDIDAYFSRFPGVKQYQLDSHAAAKRDGFVTNLFGRMRRIPDAKKIDKIYGPQKHADYNYEVRGLLNLAVNHPIQSTGASIVNRAAIRFHKDCKDAGIEAKLVAQVHDSMVVECNEADADNVLLLLQNAMENTVILPGVSLEAIPKIGRNLAEV